MIVNCRLTFPQKFRVTWEAKKLVKGIRHSYYDYTFQEKVFESYSDMNGFVNKIQKKANHKDTIVKNLKVEKMD
jgi:hypothetical protein